MKIKLDADSLKELCLNHLEKVIFAFFVICFLITVWSSLGLKGLDKKPSELQSIVTRAQENLDREQEVVTPVEDYLTMVDTITRPIQLEELETPVAWNPSLFPARKKRGEPQALTVEELQVVSGRGKVNRSGRMSGEVPGMMDEEEGDEEVDYYESTPTSTTRGLHWCIVTGAIPYKKQEEAFLEALGGAGQLTPRDEPTYASYQVERAEVPLDGDTSKLKWEKLDISPKGENYKIAKEIGSVSGSHSSSGMSGEMDMRYEPPQLMRYPPARSRVENMGRSSSMVPGDDRGLIPSNTYTLLNPLPPIANSMSTINWNKIIPYPEGIRMTTASSQRRNQRAMIRESVEELDEYSEEDEMGEMPEEMVSSHEMTQEMRKASRRLFRFVDYTVLPGVQYCYRVKLLLHNPNYNYKPTHFVLKESLTKERYLESTWSEPSTVAAVIRDERFLLGGIEMVAEKPTDKRKNPYLSLMLVKFDEETGDELSAFFRYITLDTGKTRRIRGEVQKIELKQPFLPGQQLTLAAKPSELTSLTGAAGMGAPSSRGMGMGMQGYGTEEEEEAQTFDTGFLLLDVMGGKEELYRGVTITKESEGGPVYAQVIKDYPDAIYSPTRVLLMNADGELVIQSELTDLPEVYPRLPKIDRNMMPENEPMETSRRSSRKKKKNTEGGGLLDRY